MLLLLVAVLHQSISVSWLLSKVNTVPLFLVWCLIRQGLRGWSGPQRLIRARGEETGNPIMAFHRPRFSPSFERAPHCTPTTIPPRIPCGRWSTDLTLSLALPNPLSHLLVTRRHSPKLFQGGRLWVLTQSKATPGFRPICSRIPAHRNHGF